MATFTFIPDFNASADRQPRVRTARFGDGYEQRQGDGLNTLPEIWTLTFNNRATSEIDAIETFLRLEGGVTTFDWTPPRSAVPGKYICRRWQRSPVSGALDSLSATFEQVFEA